MPLLKLKCETCGAELVLNPEKNVAKCTYCGVEYVIQQEVKNVYMTNPIENVHMKELSAEEWYEKGRSYEHIEDRHESVKCYKEAYRLEPENGCYMYHYYRSANDKEGMEKYYVRYSKLQEWEKAYIKDEGSFWVYFERRDWERCEYALEHISGFRIEYGGYYTKEERVSRLVENKEYDLVERLFSYDKAKCINVFCGKQRNSMGEYYKDKYSYYDLWYLGQRVTKENWNTLLKKPKSDKRIIELIEKYYDIPEEVKEEPNPIKRFIKKGICPICGKKLDVLKSCKSKGRGLDPIVQGCNISFLLNMHW